MTSNRWSARRTLNAAKVLGAIGFVFAAAASAQDTYDLSWYTISAGGVMAGGDYEQACVIGQVAVGETGGGDYSLSAGFLVVPSPDVLYHTGFEPEEGFELGWVGTQEEWTVSQCSDEPRISTNHAFAGTQHLRFSHESASLPCHAVSPTWGPLPPGTSTTTSVQVAISSLGGSYYDVGAWPVFEPEGPGWEVRFTSEGEIRVLEPSGSGYTYVDTGAGWVVGDYRNLTVYHNPAAGATEYYYDGEHIYSQVQAPPATRVEHVILSSQNLSTASQADFDNLLVVRGLSVPESECTPPPPPQFESMVSDAGYGTRNRYVSFTGRTSGASEAVRVRFDLGDGQGEQTMWVGEPFEVTELSGETSPAPSPSAWYARLECSPFATNWNSYDAVHIVGDWVLQDMSYTLEIVESGSESLAECYSVPLMIVTSRCGDVVGECAAEHCQTTGEGYTDCCTPPDGVVDFQDIPAVVDKFINLPGAPLKSRADIAPSTVDFKIDFSDIPEVVNAFLQLPTACPPPSKPAPCPPNRPAARSTVIGPPVVVDPAIISLQPSTARVRPGESVDVDVYAARAAGLRVYQLSLAAMGGESGELKIKDLRVDELRDDYAFGSAAAIAAADKVTPRLGATLIEGSVSVRKPAYLGTFTLVASADARGTFDLVLSADDATFLRDPNGKAIPFQVAEPVSITVRAAPGLRESRKTGR